MQRLYSFFTIGDVTCCSIHIVTAFEGDADTIDLDITDRPVLVAVPGVSSSDGKSVVR